MDHLSPLEIFLVTAPGLEAALADEAHGAGFTSARLVKGGVVFNGGWPEIWRANLALRGASRVLARIAQFRVTHLAQLDKKARQIAWGDILRRDRAVRVDATCRKSKIYHSGAAMQRVETAIAEELGAPIDAEAEVRVLVRIDNDLCTISLDTSGDPLHKRGAKQAVNVAPMRETTAALLLRQCGYRGTEPVLDPMCGSGTFVIEAAEIAQGLLPGRARAFAFEKFANFDADALAMLRAGDLAEGDNCVHYGSDKNAGAIRMSIANAERAGISRHTRFSQTPVEALERPEGPAGLVIVNPPFGSRIGERKALRPLYAALGRTLSEKFSGWRVGMVTTDPALARATGLAFKPAGPSIDNNGISISLYQTDALA